MNSTKEEVMPEPRRLEELWGGYFGNDYVPQNRAAGNVRGAFRGMILQEFPVASALEVGCNQGANRQWVAAKVPPRLVDGVEINLSALTELHRHLPEVNATWTPARALPSRNRWFDLVFTIGVLIYQPESTLPLAMVEIVGGSRRYIFWGEYFSAQTTEVFYRGPRGALFQRGYGGVYQELFPELRRLKEGFPRRAEDWEDVTYWRFEKPGAYLS